MMNARGTLLPAGAVVILLAIGFCAGWFLRTEFFIGGITARQVQDIERWTALHRRVDAMIRICTSKIEDAPK